MSEGNKPTTDTNKEANAVQSKEDKKPTINIEGFLKVTGLFLTAGALFFTCQTYTAAQKWKAAEFTSQKFKEFSENKSVRLAGQMLDYNLRLLDLFDKDTLIVMNDDILKAALSWHRNRGAFSKTELKIRDIFDEYFDQLSLFNRYIKTELMSVDQIQPYLDYHVRIIADSTNSRKSPELRNTILDYINLYRFDDVKELSHRFGFDIKSSTDSK